MCFYIERMNVNKAISLPLEFKPKLTPPKKKIEIR